MISIAPSFSELIRTFGKIGLLSFGGPAGQIALMHKMLVDEKKWLEEKQFLHALSFCMLLPGPEAMQLATYCGWLLHGVRGGLVAGLLFILPGFFVLLALSAAYVFLGDQTWMAGLLFGLKAAVLALVLEALLRVSKRALKDGFAYALAALAFVAIALLKLPFPLIVLAAAIAGALRYKMAANPVQPDFAIQSTDLYPPIAQTIKTMLVWLAVWLLPLGALIWLDPGNGFFGDAAIFFSKAAAVTFGGAYAVLVYTGQQAVDVYGWLQPGEMVTGLGLAETTPGPLILVLVFVAFVGGARLSGFDPLIGGLLGGLTAMWFTFVPCFLWIFAGAPYVERLRQVQWLTAALAGITAAVVGIIANLAVWFALHVLFGNFNERLVGPLYIPEIIWSQFDIKAAIIAAAAGIALLRFHANLFWVIGGAAVAGVALRAF